MLRIANVTQYCLICVSVRTAAPPFFPLHQAKAKTPPTFSANNQQGQVTYTALTAHAMFLPHWKINFSLLITAIV